MELDVVAKAHSGTIKDSTLCGMSRDDFYKAMISFVFPGFTLFYAEDEPYSNEIEYSPDDMASILYSAKMFDIKRTYYIGNGSGIDVAIPEFAENVGITFRPLSKNPLYARAEYLNRFITAIDMEYNSFAAFGIYKPSAVINRLSPFLRYDIEPFSDLVATVVKWLTARLPIEDRNVFVDYLANEECYHELYVELVQFIHEYLTEQDNTVKFEL